MSDLPRTTISAAAIVSHVVPALAEAIDEAVYTALGDDLSYIGEQLERLANAAELIAGHLASFNPNN